MVAKTRSGKTVTIAAPNAKKDQALFGTYDFKGSCLMGAYGKYEYELYHLATLGYAYITPAS